MRAERFLSASAASTPLRTALISGGSRYTYDSIDRMSDRLAWSLMRHGLRPGDRVVEMLPNGPEAVLSIFAILKAGGVVVPLHPTTKAERLRVIFSDCEPSALIADRSGALQVERAGPAISVATFLVSTETIAADARHRWVPLAALVDDDVAGRLEPGDDTGLAFLIYTSGSTGEPKAVMASHANAEFVSASIIQYLQSRADDVVLNALPLSFSYGLYNLLVAFRVGATLVLERSFAYSAELLARVAAERVTGLSGVPSFFAVLLSLDLSRFDLSSLRYVTNAGAALAPAQVLDLCRRLPWARFYSMYGQTECTRALYLPPEDVQRKPGSVGIPIPGTCAWIEDDKGARLRPGSIGELVVRGRHVTRGYWRRPEATAAAFTPSANGEDSSLRTGDLFVQDEDGYFSFVARKDGMLKSGGQKVAPREVEDAICALPGVSEAVVVGRPDPILGQAVTAFVTVHDAAVTEAILLRHCRATLETYKVPAAIEILDALPRTPNGKVDRGALATRAAQAGQ